MRVLPSTVPRAEVAQLVEHSTENAGVTGSIPVLGTNINFARVGPLQFPHARCALEPPRFRSRRLSLAAAGAPSLMVQLVR